MNAEKNLILVKGEDKTDQIRSWEYQDGRIVITYNNSPRPFPYAHYNVQFFKDPAILFAKDFAVLKRRAVVSGVVRMLNFGEYIKLEYKTGYKETLPASDIQLIKSCLTGKNSGNIFEYLKQVAFAASVKGEDGSNILGKRYSKIDFIREDSVLASYLSGKLPNSQASSLKELIYPFGFNASQKHAVEQAFCNSVSVIEGPPGTGKTQTILNIIANAVMRGESVAVVSSNNSATMNVLEKLQKNSADFIAAYLGNTQNKEDFISRQTGAAPNLGDWALSSETQINIRSRLLAMIEELDKMLETKNQLAALLQKKQAITLEQQHFLRYYEESECVGENRAISRMKSAVALRLWAECEIYEGIKKISAIKKIFNILRFGITDFSFYNLSIENMIALCQKRYYEAAINEIEKQAAKLTKTLSDYNFDEKMKEYSALSMQLFKNSLAKKYNQGSRKIFEQDDLWKHSDEFIKEYPVVLSTTYSLRSSLSHQHVYDYVIVDEVSQVNLATGALAFSCAKKAVIVGDLKQLPNVVDSNDTQSTNHIFESFSIPEHYRYAEHSILSSVIALFPDVSRTMLREHYRCHPKIIEFCNQKFYDGQLIVMTEGETADKPLAAYETVAGNHARGHLNQREIDVILNEIIPEYHIDTQSEDLGIVTPYDAQRNALQELFRDTGVKADSVDKFQGQERKTIIISTVDNSISEFTDQPNRLNVAVSRAVDQLILVTNGNDREKDTNIRDLIRYIRYNNLEVIESKTYSVFDFLYAAYAQKRTEILRNSNRISEYDSENLMHGLIKEVLSAERFTKFDVACHAPLKMILRDVSKLDDEETRYAMNVLTHVDFLIYDRLSKTPVLIVEVDGFSFHEEGTRQAERDKLKNAILEKYEMPFIRFSTNGSKEKELLLERLSEFV